MNKKYIEAWNNLISALDELGVEKSEYLSSLNEMADELEARIEAIQDEMDE